MKLVAHQRRILGWIADDSNPRDPQSIADCVGSTYDTVITACGALKRLGLIEKHPRVTDAGRALLAKE